VTKQVAFIATKNSTSLVLAADGRGTLLGKIKGAPVLPRAVFSREKTTKNPLLAAYRPIFSTKSLKNET
jgi:hypothetical protein